MRLVVLAIALAFILLLGALTVTVALDDGFGARFVVSVIVLALLGFGIVGALLHRPDE